MTYRIFLIIPPGFEDLALEEITSKCPVPQITTHKGGLELTADLDWIVKAHCLLKLPTRMLLRLLEFKVRDFPKLHQRLERFKWHDVLTHPLPEFVVSSSESRLMHTGRIEETARGALQSYFEKQPLSLDYQKKNYSPQTLYLRLKNDLLTVSVDLTGEPLYKRGHQIIKGEAPIRENFAAGLLMELFRGLDQEVRLVDPMCGSGTFLTEALNFHIPLHLRKFSFEEMAFFKGKMVRLPLVTRKLPVKAITGMDLNEVLIHRVKEETSLDLRVQDSLKSPIQFDEDFVMITNPPYGERIKIEGKRGSFLQSAWKKFLTEDRPLRFGWVLPSDMDDLFKEAPGYQLIHKKAFKNGGLPVTFWVWEREINRCRKPDF